MTKKHLLFALIVCMSTVWRFLELLEYGEIEVRQVDTYMYFYMLATCFVSFLVGKESATAKKAKEQKPLMEELSNATRCPNEAERKKYHESRNQICHNEKRSQGIYVHLQR